MPTDLPSHILNLAFLRRQTFDDRDLERELLHLFEKQCARLVPVAVEGAEDRSSQRRAEAAHTLKGAALAIGAERVAAAAARLEAALEAGEGAPTVQRRGADLRRTVHEAGPAIAALLGR